MDWDAISVFIAISETVKTPTTLISNWIVNAFLNLQCSLKIQSWPLAFPILICIHHLHKSAMLLYTLKNVTYLYSYCSCKHCCVRYAVENVQTFTPCSPKNAVSVSQHLFTIMSVKKPACQLYIKHFWQQKHKHWSILSSLPLCVILEKAFLPLILKMFILRTLCK